MLNHRAPQHLHTIHDAIDTQISQLNQDHAYFCDAEHALFQEFLDRECLHGISDLRTFMQTVQQRMPAIEQHVMDVIRKREKQMLRNELRLCRLRREGLAAQMESLPYEIARGKERLLNDAMAK